jgi:hypothetical protein
MALHTKETNPDIPGPDRFIPLPWFLREIYSFELEDQLTKETSGDCSNTPATASSSTGSTAVLTSVVMISVASGDRSTTSICPASAPVRQIYRVEERRISGSS